MSLLEGFEPGKVYVFEPGPSSGFLARMRSRTRPIVYVDTVRDTPWRLE
jgi:hypothetical protein